MEQYSANLFRSSVTQNDVDALIVKYQILSSINLRPPFETDHACSRLENEVCLYIGSFEGGLRLPFPKIVREVLEFYGLAPAQITPNSWRHLIGCAVLQCAMSDGATPLSMEAFVNVYNLKKVSSFNGWWYFSEKDAKEPIISGLPTANKDCKDKFFFVGGSGWEFPDW